MSIFAFFRRLNPQACGSEHFRTFHRNFVAASDSQLAREGLEVDVIERLTPDERAEAERLLISRLESGGDSRTAIGLGLLRSQAAAPALRRCMARQSGLFASSAYALALWRIAQDPSAVDAAVAIARNAHVNGTARVDAVIALSEMRSELSRRTLMDLLQSEPDYLIRYHSFKGLLMLHGDPWARADHEAGEIAPQIGGLLVNPAARQQVLARLVTLIAGRTLAA